MKKLLSFLFFYTVTLFFAQKYEFDYFVNYQYDNNQYIFFYQSKDPQITLQLRDNYAPIYDIKNQLRHKFKVNKDGDKLKFIYENSESVKYKPEFELKKITIEKQNEKEYLLTYTIKGDWFATPHKLIFYLEPSEEDFLDFMFMDLHPEITHRFAEEFRKVLPKDKKFKISKIFSKNYGNIYNNNDIQKISLVLEVPTK